MSSAGLRARALEYLWQTFPSHCVVLTDPQLRVLVELGIERGGAHGYTDADDVCSYLGLMVILGSHFDADPQLPWAGQALAARGPIGAVYKTAIAAMDPLIGQRGEHYRRALLWAFRQPYERLERDAGAGVRGALLQWLPELYARKWQSLPASGQQALLEVIESGAQRHGLAGVPGTLLFGALVMLLGVAVDRDPAQPWLAQALAADTSSPPDKARALHREAMMQLERYMRLDRYVRGA